MIIYWSRFGNGRKCVEYTAGKLREMGGNVQLLKTSEADPAAMPLADIYIFSAPAEAFQLQVEMKKFIRKLEGMEGKKYGLINTHGMKKRNKLKTMTKLLTKKNMVKITEIDFHVGDGFQEGNGLPDGWEAGLEGFIAKLQG
ncbi:MAG: hypothetical protein JSW28_08495 [Thermoplasmata archaeon]|nr:MAG: hypothetical protein JSW28_08495 [Thermoplasmata archaeon]